MAFFINENSIRGGNRGGKHLFKWDDIRALSYKERECYLGATEKLGFLDNGDKWRKRDWWIDGKSKRHESKSTIETYKEKLLREQQEIREAEGRLLQEKLGLAKGKDKKQDKALTDLEYKNLTKRENQINKEDARLYDFYDDDTKRRGLGMKPNVSFNTNPYDRKYLSSMNQIKGKNDYEESGIIDSKVKEVKKSSKSAEESLIQSYIKSYLKESKGALVDTKDESERKSKKRRSRSRSRDREYSRDRPKRERRSK